jgi:hypothetical protein
MSIEAIKAIQMVYANTTKHDWPDDIWDAICQAIEAEKQEPVAVMQLHTDGWDLIEGIDTDWLEMLPFGTTLYTHPQPKREPLTDEQVDDLHGEANRGFCIEREDYFKAFRDAETAHGIK